MVCSAGVLKDHLIPSPLLWAPLARPSCPKAKLKYDLPNGAKWQRQE